LGTLTDSAEPLSSWIIDELDFPGELHRGSHGTPVRRVQEWLSLHGVAIATDGDFGDATEAAVHLFQQSHAGLVVSGHVDEATYASLTAPMKRVLSHPLSKPTSFPDAVVKFAAQHLAEHPREVGGQNRGPWVRLYMRGHDGTEWAWCAGFVTFLLTQAAEALRTSMPIEGSFSCDSLASQARTAGLFLDESEASAAKLTAGSIFLRRRTSTDWTHTGIVTVPAVNTFRSIEGNTNDDGNREGYEVCERVNSYKQRDFVLLS
jgi:peptidoglycan hydrolase-like protein with peptidoglycan-binding domain